MEGSHSLPCKHGSGRLARHHSINDLIHRALIRANIPSIKEPKRLLRTDNKRPDGYTLIPWRAGRNLTWDVFIVNTVAASYIQTTSVIAGSATEIASERKIVKYVELSNTSCFCPIIFETFEPINDLGLSFLDELGRRIADCTGDARETTSAYICDHPTVQFHFVSWQLCCCIMWETTLVVLSRISPSTIICNTFRNWVLRVKNFFFIILYLMAFISTRKVFGCWCVSITPAYNIEQD